MEWAEWLLVRSIGQDRRGLGHPKQLTFDLLVLGLGQEELDAIRGDGKGDAGCHLERVDADDLTVLNRGQW